jgi:uncharacterized protein (UPF0333 family)
MFQQMLVKDLKKELEKRGLSSKGRKAELVARLEEAVANEKNADSTESQVSTTEGTTKDEQQQTQENIEKKTEETTSGNYDIVQNKNKFV